MLEGWYCRTLAIEQAADGHQIHLNKYNISPETEEIRSCDDSGKRVFVNFKDECHFLSRKIRFLLYENEYFQDSLKSCQRRLLKVSRDRSFLLDRLLQYEKPLPCLSEIDDTGSSDESSQIESRKRKSGGSLSVRTFVAKKRNLGNECKTMTNAESEFSPASPIATGHMTAEEVERHLQSRQTIKDFVTEKAPITVPTEMFSNEPSLDSNSNGPVETSSSNI